MMRTLVLLRHGTAGTRQDWSGDDADRPLDERGRRQAAAAPSWLAEAGVDVGGLLSSPMARCVATLHPLAEELGLEIATDERLAEIEVPASSDDGWPNAAWLGARALGSLDDHLDADAHMGPAGPVDPADPSDAGGRVDPATHPVLSGPVGDAGSAAMSSPARGCGRGRGALVVCSHGEILPALLAALAGRFGVGVPDGLDLTRKTMPKGGAWVCEGPTARATGSERGARELTVTELPPPC